MALTLDEIDAFCTRTDAQIVRSRKNVTREEPIFVADLTDEQLAAFVRSNLPADHAARALIAPGAPPAGEKLRALISGEGDPKTTQLASRTVRETVSVVEVRLPSIGLGAEAPTLSEAIEALRSAVQQLHDHVCGD